MSAPSFESVVAHYGLTGGQLHAECGDDVLRSLAPRMNRWRNIDLELDSGVVDAIERESSTDDEGKRRKLLERWKEKFGHEATYERLVRDFVASDRSDLAGIVCEACKKIVPCASESQVILVCYI